MTNLILTVIGIVLAAIAALVAFDYGGDYFLEGYNRAQATSISNAGNNVTAAYSVFGVQRRRAPANLAELTTSVQGRSLLKRIPEVQDLGVVRDQWVGLNRGNGLEKAFVVEGVSANLCRTLNQRLNAFVDDAVIPGTPAFKSGCFAFNGTTVNVYYSFLGGVPDGGAVGTYRPVVTGSPLPAPLPSPTSNWTWPGAPTMAPSALPTTTPAPTQPITDGGWVDCAAEGARCDFAGEATVRFGIAPATFAYTSATASLSCSTASFEGDPAENQVKSCSYRPIGQPDGWVFCANEGAACDVGAGKQAEMRFGSLGSYVTKKLKTGTVCSPTSFANDPALNQTKACYYRNVENIPTPVPTATATATPGVGVVSCTSGGTVGTLSIGDPDGIVGAILPSTMCRGDDVISPGGRFRLSFQSDGNLVLYTTAGDALWSTGTNNTNASHFDVQPNGEAIMYGTDGGYRWRSYTYDQRGQMRLTSDGNLVIYNNAGNQIVWETRTDICLTRSITDGVGLGGYGRSASIVPKRMCNSEYVDSPDGRFRLKMQPDGNLVLYMGDDLDQSIWASGTGGKDFYKLVTDANGELRGIGRDGGNRFRTYTYDNAGARMMLEDDGNLVVRNPVNNQLLWETRTERCAPKRVGDGRRAGDFNIPGTVVPSRLCVNEFVESPDGRFRLSMDPDGNLVLRMGENFATPIWASNTVGDMFKLVTDANGELRGIGRDGGNRFRTYTYDNPGARMSLQSDGNLVVRTADNKRLLWETRSIFCLPTERGSGTVYGDFAVAGTYVAGRVCNNEYVTSPNGLFRLKMQPDGNLVLYTGEDFAKAIWASGTNDAYALFQQDNGNWQVVARDGGWRWRTQTWDNGGARMIVQDDGNLVVRTADNARLLWESRTVSCLPAEKGVGTVSGDFGTLGTLVGARVCTNEYVTSPNGKFRLTMKPDGDLVLGTGQNFATVIWNTGANGAYALFQQGNGNWQTENKDGWRWRTQTWDNGGARMIVQDDGNLVVRTADNARLLWETRSTRCVPMEKGVGTIATEHGESGTLVGPRVCTNEYVTSPNGLFRLTMQPNGSLVVGTGENFQEIIWQTGASDAYTLYQQGSGNWQTEGRDGGWRWRTQTWDRTGARMILQNDGNLVVRTADNAGLLWETRTDRCQPREWNDGVGVDNLNTPGTYVNWRLCNNQYVTSPNGRFRLTMRTDGNLVIGMGANYSDVIWSTNTTGDSYKLIREGSGNVQLIGRDGGWRWRTQTWDRPGARMMLNDLGNLVVVRNPGELFWESRTDRCLPASISAGTETSPSGSPATIKPFILFQNEWIDSPNGRFRFTLNAQGNLQLLDGVNHDILLWQSGTNDPRNYRFFSWGDGNHWIMNRDGTNVWQTRTYDNSGARMLVQDDGNVAIYNGTRMIWQTGTGGKTGPAPGSVDDLAFRLRQAGTKAVNGAKALVKLPGTLADVGMTDADVSEFGQFKYFYQAGEQLNFEVVLSGANADKVCTAIATATGGTLSDTARESTTAEGCASFNTGYYYWRRVDDAQTPVQVQFVRSFGTAVLNGSKNLTARPSSLSSVGMAGAERYNLLDRSGFEEAGENWQFYIKVNSAAACRAIDAAVGNPARTIDANNGFSYTLDEGCGGEGGSYFYWKNVNAAYDDAIAKKVMAMGSAASAAALSNGGETTSTGRDAASASLSMAADGYGFITKTGVYQSGEHYTGEVRILSGAACRRIDALAGNGDRGAGLSYAPEAFVQGCGRYSDGTYWYWRRLDQGVLPGAVFDAKQMFSMDANDDPEGIWNYLESNPAGGADIPLMNKGGCSWGNCVRGDVDAIHIADTNVTRQDSTSILDATTLNMHPGPDRDALLRFRAPAAGWYRVTGRFNIGDTSPSGINVDWGQGSFYLDGNTRSYSFNYNRRFAQGETMVFRLNNAGRYNNDGTHLNATLTYLGTNAPPPAGASTGHRFWRVLGVRANGDSDVIAASEIEFRATAGGPNLVSGAGGTPIASAQYSGGFATPFAFDGNPSTAWASPNGNRSFMNQWIGYDFGDGRAVDVKEVAWRSRSDSAAQSIGSGRLQWSDDGSSWTTSFNFTVDPLTANGQTSVISEPKVLADAHRYWRVRGFALNDPYMRSSEIEMRETSDGPNVARYGIPLASSYYSEGYNPFYVFNGTTGGNAWATTGGIGWIGVDMLVPRAINEFKYASAEGSKAPTDFALEWSDDGVNWQRAWRNKFTAWGNTEFRTFTRPDPNAPPPPPVVATSIVLTSVNGTCMQIAEFEAYSGGVNVASASNGGVASGSQQYNSDTYAGRINDGVKPSSYPEIFHSQCGAGDFAKVTFAQPVTLDRLVIYGRQNCCQDRDLFAYKIYNGTTLISGGTLDARNGGATEDEPLSYQSWTLGNEYPDAIHFEYSSSEGPLVRETSSSWWKRPGYQYWGTLTGAPNEAVMHPGPGASQATIVNFVAPAAGSYSFTGRFNRSSCDGDGVITQVGGFDPITVRPCSVTDFSFTRTLNAGDRLPFSITNNGTDAADSTILTLVVKPR
jgi:hypothetical protein